MLLKNENTVPQDLLENWPVHYYETKDPRKREELLNAQLRLHPDEERDQKRHEIFQHRYGTDGKYADGFMKAWMLLKLKENEGNGFLLRKRRTQETASYLKMLLVDDAQNDVLLQEWRDFAETLILSNAGSKTYRSVLFGMMSADDEETACRIAKDIRICTRDIPALYGFSEAVKPLQEVFHQTYTELIHNGEIYWQRIFEEK